MTRRNGVSSRRLSVVALLAIGAGVLVAVGGSSSADVTAVQGGAVGYQASFTLFGGGPFVFGPEPTVTLPEGGSATPITAGIPSARVAQGPGVLFTSGPQEVSTQGTTGPNGSVTSTAHIENVPTSTVGEILYAGTIDATCTATETDPATGAKTQTGSVTITGPGDAGRTGATLRTSDGNPDIEGDETYFDIPLNPEPNLTVNGTLESVGDTYQVIFNEQVILPDGSLQVTAVHERLIGPTAIGDVYIGRVVCGVSTVPATTTTSPTTSSTIPTSSTTTSSTMPTSSTTTSSTIPTSSTTTSSTIPTSSTTTSSTIPTSSTTTSSTIPTSSTTTSSTVPTSSTTTSSTIPTSSTTTSSTIPTSSTTTSSTIPTSSTTTSTTVPPTICDTLTSATTTTVAQGASPTAEASPSSVAQGGETDVTGEGFSPGESLDLNLCTTPVPLGTVTADASGAFQTTVTIPATTSVGAHTIVVSNRDRSRIATAGITVVAADTGGPGGGGTTTTGGGALSRTGVDSARMAWLAGLVLVMGLWLVRAARRAPSWGHSAMGSGVTEHLRRSLASGAQRFGRRRKPWEKRGWR